MREMFSSLRARVLLLIAIPFAVMLGTTIYHTLGEREDRLTNARARVLDTARAIAGERLRINEHVHQVLLSVALLPEVRRGVASEGCNCTLAARHQQELNLISITVVATTLSLAWLEQKLAKSQLPEDSRVVVDWEGHIRAGIPTPKSWWVTQLSRAVRALRVLSAGNRTVLHTKQGEQHLLEEMCRAIGEAGGYPRAI